jgi:hypothetical protein
MPQVQDPLQSLLGFQEALTAGFIQPGLSPLYPDLLVLHDDAEGTPRFTYALMEGKAGKAIAVYFLERSVGNIPYFDVGYAVAEPYRQQGNAHAVVKKSLAQLQHEARGKVLKLCIPEGRSPSLLKLPYRNRGPRFGSAFAAISTTDRGLSDCFPMTSS